MGSETLYTLIIISFGYILYLLLKKQKKNKAKNIFSTFLSYLDDYELEVLKHFDEYLITRKIIIYQNNEKQVVENSQFINANIPKAFSEIKHKLSEDVHRSLYILEEEIKNDYFQKLNSTFNSHNKKDKLHFVNKKIENLAINIAIENYYSSKEENHNKALGAEFIVLNSFLNEMLLGYAYPENNYNHLNKMIKLRKDHPNLSFEDFLEEI